MTCSSCQSDRLIVHGVASQSDGGQGWLVGCLRCGIQFTVSNARITALRELFTDYVDTETGEMGLGVFVEETEGETTLKVFPVDKAPKFIQSAQEGVYPKELPNG